jgi:hypothetical protein
LSRHLSIRLSSLRWPMEGSMAARRLIQRHTEPTMEPRLRRLAAYGRLIGVAL